MSVPVDNTKSDELSNHALNKIKLGEQLIQATEKYKHIEGLQKLQRKVNQELKFLRKILKNNSVKKEHLQCSNLTHFQALIQTLSSVEGCTNISKVFMLDEKKVVVDLICDNGVTWMKVIARNPKSLSQISMGDTSFGVRSVLDQAREYVECAKLNPCLFQTPKIVFVFANGVGTVLASKIEAFGITVKGERLSDVDKIMHYDLEEDDDNNSNINSSEPPKDDSIMLGNSDLSTKNVEHINKVNLDVSAMLAYCSSVTNGSAHLYDFSVKVLAQQAEWERQRPQKPILDKFFQGKKLYCCQTAHDNFLNIVHTVGGPQEGLRAKELLERLTVLPDDATDEDTSSNVDEESRELFKKVQFTPDKVLKCGGKIKQRSLVIFTFGDRIGAVTVTANDGFVRAAKQQVLSTIWAYLYRV